jgi:class 3 adenylate cyclase
VSAEQTNLLILQAEVAGSDPLRDKLGEAEALRALERCVNRMSRAVEQYHGRVAQIVGDNLCATFSSPDAGLLAACEMQQRVDSLPPISGVKLSLRVAFHFGAASEENGILLGPAATAAARMSDLAQPAQILTGDATVAALSPVLRRAARETGAKLHEAGMADVRLHEIVWKENEELTKKASSVLMSPPAGRLALRHGEQEMVLDGLRNTLALGRDPRSDLVVNDRRASRTHARIERRWDKYVLVDQSTNGTFIRFEGEREFALKHEEVVLRGRGRISFGHRSEVLEEIVQFEVLG